MTNWRSRLVALVAAAGIAAATPAAYAGSDSGRGGDGHGGDGRGHGHSRPVTVMTRNLYLGADIERPVAAATAAQAAGKSLPEIVLALGHATNQTRAIVDQTNFPLRARLLAREIARSQPDLVGLQEVAQWRSGPMELTAIGVPNATTVDYDFLQILLDELAKRGAKYDAVNVGMRADVESPSFSGNPFAGQPGPDPKDVRMTMRDVILKRHDHSLKVAASGGGIYTHNLQVSVAGVPMNFDRGYQWVDVTQGRDSFRFVNTHLEAFSSDLALAQASELLAVAAPTDRDVIFVCDCNSDPLNNSVKSFDHVPHKAPYDLITGAGGFTDEWLEFRPAEQGWTSGLSELVNDATPAGFDHRIDMVFARTASGDGLEVDGGTVTGTRLADRDRVSGLWPSDHAGVVLTLDDDNGHHWHH